MSRRPVASTAPSVGRPADVPSAPRRRLLLGAGALGTLAAGCGGGGTELAGVGTGGTGQVATFTSGPISGFGSVIVNGIRFDDTSASIADELGAARKASDLGLGMVVEIDGTADLGTGLGTARSIRVISLLAGQVGAIDGPAARFTVMSVTVGHDSATVWNVDDGATALRVGDRVEIWGFLDVTSNVLCACRVEIAATGDVAAPAKVRGTVTAFDASNRWMSVDGQYVDLRDVPSTAGLAVGATVAALGAQINAPNAPLRATTLAVVAQAKTEQTGVANVENVISAWSSIARFRLLDTWVDASAATFEGGPASALRNGIRVRAIGERVDGVLKARLIEVRSVPATGPNSSEVGSDGSGNATANGGSTSGDGTTSSTANASDGGNGTGMSNGGSANANVTANANANANAGNGNSNANANANANASTTSATASTPPGRTPTTSFVVDKVQVTGSIITGPRANRIVVMDTARRRFTVNIKDASILGGRRADLDPGALVRVTGINGSPIDAAVIQVVRRAS